MTAPRALDFLGMIRPREEAFRQHHREDRILVSAAMTVNFSCGYLYWLQRTMNDAIQQPPAWDKVAALYLLTRAMDDLRAALECGERGAPVQGMSLLASVYEVEAVLLEIGHDPAKGQMWVTGESETGLMFSDSQDKHGKPIKKRLSEMGSTFYYDLGITGMTLTDLKAAHKRRYGEIYSELCGYKHVQPSVQRRYGATRTSSGMEVQPGPQWTPYMRKSVLALYEVAENLAEHIFLAVALTHSESEQRDHAARFIKQMRSAWFTVVKMENERPRSGEEEHS